LPLDFRTVARSRAPLRLGLAGGGTDLSPYCDEFGGAVLNTTIDRFAYAFISPRDDDRIVFRAKDLRREEIFESATELPQAGLLLHRGVYVRMVRDYNGGQAISATITTTVDAPAGSGLGSSSALVVALVDAFRTFLGYRSGNMNWHIWRSRSSASIWACPAGDRTNIPPLSEGPTSSSSSGPTALSSTRCGSPTTSEMSSNPRS
jgi:hypothetical protein